MTVQIFITKLVVITFLFLIQIGSLNAKPTDTKESRKVADIETIDVVGSRPLNYFFKLREQKRFTFMETFNHLIEDEDLHFECRDDIPTGSHIKTEVCRNAFDWRIIEEIVEYEIRRGNITSAYAVALMGNDEQREKQKTLLGTINTLLIKNPEFLKSFTEFETSDDIYKKAHREKFGVLSPHTNK